MARNGVQYTFHQVAHTLQRTTQQRHITVPQRHVERLSHPTAATLVPLRPHTSATGIETLQKHVPIRCLSPIQDEKGGMETGTEQPAQYSSLRLHHIRQCEHLQLRLQSLRSHPDALRTVQHLTT